MNNKEYLDITEKCINNRKFKKLINEKHHYVTNRYSHNLEVSYRTYKVCKYLKLDYKSATRAALVHDFFFDDEFNNKISKLTKHPQVAFVNASKLYHLNEKEQNIIKSHMFPFGGSIPKCRESVVVDLIDDYVSIKERCTGDLKYLVAACKFLFIAFISLIK